MAAIDYLEISDPPALWRELGFAVDGGACRVGGTVIGLGAAGRGVIGWRLSGTAPLPGLPEAGEARWPDPPNGPDPNGPHPNGVVGLDHVVVTTPDLDRTVAAFEGAGLALRRTRATGTPGEPLVQAFFKLGDTVVEVVGPPGRPEPGAARFWGLAFTVSDLAATAAFLGDRLRPAKDAVQPGRRIATLDRSAGSALPLAFMSRRA